MPFLIIIKWKFVLFLNNLIIDITTGLELVITINGPVYDISVLIAYAQKLPINAHADVARLARGLSFSLSFMYVRCKCSGKSAQLPWVCLQFVIVVFPDHTHLLFF